MSSYWIVCNTACNMRCKHCFEHDFEKQKLDIEHVATFVEKIDYNTSVNLFGGEPTMDFEHFISIVDMLFNSAKINDITVFTNGKFDFEFYNDRLTKYKSKLGWQLSIQSIHGGENIKSEVDTLNWIVLNFDKYTINTVMVKDELEHIHGVIDYLNSLGVLDRLYLSTNRIEKDFYNYKPVIVELVKRLVDLSFENKSNRLPSILEYLFKSVPGCSAINKGGISSYSTLGVDGKMYSCHHANNIKSDTPIREMIKRCNIDVAEWSKDMRFESEYTAPHNINSLAPCVMDATELEINEARTVLDSIYNEIKAYVTCILDDLDVK